MPGNLFACCVKSRGRPKNLLLRFYNTNVQDDIFSRVGVCPTSSFGVFCKGATECLTSTLARGDATGYEPRTSRLSSVVYSLGCSAPSSLYPPSSRATRPESKWGGQRLHPGKSLKEQHSRAPCDVGSTLLAYSPCYNHLRVEAQGHDESGDVENDLTLKKEVNLRTDRTQPKPSPRGVRRARQHLSITTSRRSDIDIASVPRLARYCAWLQTVRPQIPSRQPKYWAKSAAIIALDLLHAFRL